MLWPLEIKGRGGRTIRDLWGDDDPRAYLGITVPRFPNLFVTYGPNTNLAHGGSIIFHHELPDPLHIAGIARDDREGSCGARSATGRADDYKPARRREMPQHGVGASRVTSWYKNRHNRVTVTSPCGSWIIGG